MPLVSSQIDDGLAFEGTWTKRHVTGLGETSTEETYDVAASGARYRVVRHREHFDDIKVFDGQQVFEQSLQTSDDFAGATTGGRVSQQRLSDATLSKARFWARRVRGSEKTGDTVCGRPTRYFLKHGQNKRLVLEIWLDQDRDVMLRRRETFVNVEDGSKIGFDPSRLSEIPDDRIRTQEWECAEIEFGATGENAFDAPAAP